MHMIFDISSDPSNNSLMIYWATVTYLQLLSLEIRNGDLGVRPLLHI